MGKKLKNKKKHLEEWERFCIEKLLRIGKSFSEIAKVLGRGLSTISEEVNENGGRLKYDARIAQHRAYLKQYWKKRNCNKVAMDGHLSHFVEKNLMKGWSPETISKRLEIQSGLKYASGKSIRKFIPSRHGLERFLFWERNRMKSGWKRKKEKLARYVETQQEKLKAILKKDRHYQYRRDAALQALQVNTISASSSPHTDG